jgi:hypothetical protein
MDDQWVWALNGSGYNAAIGGLELAAILANTSPGLTAQAAPLADSPPPADAANDQRSQRPARTGFQMAFRTGLAFPSGKASGTAGDSLARRYSWHWPLQLDLGSKVTEHVHVGGYMG